MTDVLETILTRTGETVAASRAALPIAEVEALARAAPPARGFHAALASARAQGRFGLIAEIKKASPSHGLIRADFDPAALARAYRAGGACCLSVLTDTPFFQGEPAHLTAVRAAVDLPILRKDFMIDPYQIVEARALGADCILLILAALSDSQAAELEACAHDTGLDVLIEVHDDAELERALKLKSPLIGVNNRNLKTLAVDLATSAALGRRLPADRLGVSESGLKRLADLQLLAGAGFNSFLVGETLMRESDVAAATRRLLGLAA